MKNLKQTAIIIALLTMFNGCKKGFLDVPPDKKLLIPTTLDDLQSILDNNSVMNQSPFMGYISADDFYTTDQGLQSRELIERNSYLWAEDLYESTPGFDWNRLYEQIFYANVVLEGTEKLSDIEKQNDRTGQITGAAFFYRAFALHHLANEFTAPYTRESAVSKPGVPIPLSADVNEKKGRGTLAQTYQQIIDDLTRASEMLPEVVLPKSRPNRAAAFALKARVYLSMQNYEQALLFADKCLLITDTLLDYNVLTTSLSSSTRPFPEVYSAASNPEVLFYSPIINVGFLSAATTIVDSVLFNLYAPDDLRRSAFFVDRGNKTINFKGSYSGRSPVTIFAGLATDEVYLIAAECRVRLGDFSGANTMIENLLTKRWKSGLYPPFNAGSDQELLSFILKERRKELIGRGIRWSDLRRLNNEPLLQETLVRTIGGENITLLPNSVRYTFSIPDQEIQLSGIAQNPR